jgi:urease accessory protein UreE
VDQRLAAGDCLSGEGLIAQIAFGRHLDTIPVTEDPSQRRTQEAATAGDREVTSHHKVAGPALASGDHLYYPETRGSTVMVRLGACPVNVMA